MDRKVPRVALGLAALALLAVVVLAVMSGFEAGVAQVSTAVSEASPAQWSALTARHVPDYGAIGGVTNHLHSMARGREGMLSSGLAVRGKIGLGRIDPLHGQVRAASVAASTASYGTSAARDREGMLSSGLAVRGKIGLGRIDALHGQARAASVAASTASYAMSAALGREGMIVSGLASGQTGPGGDTVQSDAVDTHYSGEY